MISCNINPRECDDKKISSIQTDTIIETDANTRRIEILDIKKFQLFADTILSDIKGKPSSFKVITDTVFFNEMPDFEKNKTIQGFITRKSEVTFKHQFKLSSPNEVLSLTLYEAEFNSKETLDFGLIDEIIGLNGENSIENQLDGFQEYYEKEVLNKIK